MRALTRLRPRRLMAAPLAVLAVLAFLGAILAAAEPPSWLDWCPPWALAAAGAVLAVLTTWLVEPWARRRRAYADRQRDALDQLARHLGRINRLPHLREVDPLALRVHQAIPLKVDAGRGGAGGRLDSRLPTWVERDRAGEVRRWLQQVAIDGGFLLVVGNSSTGKTRLLYELLREQLGGWAVLAPDLGDGALVNTVADATFPLPPLVVWLDELHRFLPGPYLTEGSTAISAAALRRLLDAPTPVVLVGALWPEHSRELRAQDTDPATGQRRARWPAAAEILDSARRHEITLHSFTVEERRAAARLAGIDPRLAAAVADQRFGVTEVLAGAPDLLRRYDQATPTERAVLHAAADAIRLGVQLPLTDGLLAATARAYFDSARPEDTWYPPARDSLAQLRFAAAPLLPVLDPSRRQYLGWTLADYLLQHLTRHRRTVVPAAAAWSALTEQAGTPVDLLRLGDNAERRGLGRIAEALYRRAAAAAEPQASARLAGLLERLGRAEEAEQAWRDGVAAGDPVARRGLDWLLERQGRAEEAEQAWREAVAAGDPFARSRLAELLERLDRAEDAEQMWREAVTAGDPAARSGLAGLLERLDRAEEAEQMWREAVTTGDPFARGRLARLLERLGRAEEAEQMWREAVAAGDAAARTGLAGLLERLGPDQDAEQVDGGRLEPDFFDRR